ncbi:MULTISPECIES: hypothetical protein [Serratia]|uniref:hypothetical protein n=1 Tax=Serratia TaxID=613 RepID=UPI000A992C22|nr:hypothetical protein [Serratia sp. 506_PEND]
MDNVRLLDIKPDFYAFSHRVNQYTEIIISAHGWQNYIVRDGEYLDAVRLNALITDWGENFSKITIASCFSVYLKPSTVMQRLRYSGIYGYQDTLACRLSGCIPNVRVVGFIGKVYSSVDNPHAWSLYHDSVTGVEDREMLETMLDLLFYIKFDATVSNQITNPCRYVEFLNGNPCAQYGPPPLTIGDNVYTQL